VTAAQALRANGGISSPGFKLHGAGFIVTPDEAARLEADAPIKSYRNGRDLTDRPRDVKLIDLFGFDADEVRRRWPATYQWVLERVKPERDAKAHSPDGAGYAKLWWLHGKPRSELRKMLVGMQRYIATVETAKHRVFQFLDSAIAPDNMLIAIALDDAYCLGVLSSRIHVVWALAQGGTLEDRPRYNKSRCFETFPFPVATPAQQARIRDLAEQLDGHRKKVLAAHAELTLTGLYNVRQKVGADKTAKLAAKEQAIYDQGLVAVLASYHADLDAAVREAYGWADDPSDAQILERLVALNTERSAEEAQGNIRWLRPAFQAPQLAQAPIGLESGGAGQSSVGKCVSDGATRLPASAPVSTAAINWPATLPEQLASLAAALGGTPQTESQLADRFTGKGRWKARLPGILAALEALGRARRLDDGRWLG